MISEATIAKHFGSDVIGTPFGKYSRRMRFAFSLLPRCHGECGRCPRTKAHATTGPNGPPAGVLVRISR